MFRISISLRTAFSAAAPCCACLCNLQDVHVYRYVLLIVFTADTVNVDIVAEFIEVAIHCILYNRNLYPQGVFEKRKKYNVPVQVSENKEDTCFGHCSRPSC